jgi:uncharacterized protein (TIGR02270 family)
MSQIIPEVVTQQAEEAAFLWLLRDAAVGQPHYSLADLAKLDNRVEAHIDGLRVAGDDGWQILKKQLEEHTEPGEVFAAAVSAFESGKDDRIGEIVKFGTKSPEVSRGLVSALGWLSYEKAEKFIRRLLEAEAPAVRRVGIAASAIHRQNPPYPLPQGGEGRVRGRPLEQALSDADTRLRARALRAVGELGLVDLLPAVRKNLTHENQNCRFWAAWSLALASADKDAIAQLQAQAESDSPDGWPYRERAVQIATRRLEPTAAKMWERKLSQNPKQIRLAIIGAGALGDPEAVPSLIERMKNPPLARVAGEAFSVITGVHISYDNLEGEKPEGFEAGPSEKPQDENVAMDQDEHLYWPKPEAIQKWWNTHQSEFAKGTRYLVGKPITPEWLHQVLREGRQRQRAAAALELAIRQPGQPLFEVRAPGFRQQQLLSQS